MPFDVTKWYFWIHRRRFPHSRRSLPELAPSGHVTYGYHEDSITCCSGVFGKYQGRRLTGRSCSTEFSNPCSSSRLNPWDITQTIRRSALFAIPLFDTGGGTTIELREGNNAQKARGVPTRRLFVLILGVAD